MEDGIQDFAGIILFVTTPASGRLLMNLRDDIPGIAWPGKWTPIGGTREGGETPFETAHREVLEEAGIRVRDMRMIPGPRYHTHENNIPLHATFDGTDADLVLGEGQAIRLVPIAELHQLDTPPYMDHYLNLIRDAWQP
ncbi:hypothetical protein GCM10009759_77320 [Kitasatospora saccharophila]|uniref:Nudix hydrolase domain-containing protein n=1 Tax=Kitasatospora saccharophila TaxID=407973 RepID=A0ABN2YFU0_9ACTN